MAETIDIHATAQTGPQTNLPDYGSAFARAGRTGELCTSDINGKFYEQTYRGNMFIYTVAAGAAVLLPDTTGNNPTIWNPLGSGYNFVLQRLAIGFLAGTTTIGGFLWALIANAGNAIAAAGPVVTWTNVAPRNALIGGRTSAMYYSPAVSTYIAAPTVIAPTGINCGTAFPTAPDPSIVDYDGSIILTPGNALMLCYSVTTSTATFWSTIWGLELPV
jgi:hypothetical protein